MQIGALSLSSMSQICAPSPVMQASLSDPTTAFIVLDVVPTGAACDSGVDTIQLVHFTDAPTVFPTKLALANTGIIPLYAATGRLTQMLYLDLTSQNLYTYADATFSSPSVVISGIGGAGVGPVVDYYTGAGGAYIGDTWYLAVPHADANAWDLWRVPATGTATKVYNAAGPVGLFGAIADGNNIYFIDGAISQLVELSATQATPTPIDLCAISPEAQLVGSNNTNVIFYQASPGTALLASVASSGGSGQTPTAVWGSVSAGQYANVVTFDAFMATPAPNDYAASALYVSLVTGTSNGPQSRTSQMQSSGGLFATPQTLSNSAFIRTSQMSLAESGNVGTF